MNTRNKTIIFSGIAILLATIITIMLCIRSWSTMAFIATAFIIWAELSFFLGLLAVEQMARWTEQIFLRSSLIVVSSLYSCSVIIASLVFLNLLPHTYTAFWIIQVILLMLSAVLFFVIYASSKSIRTANRRTGNAVTRIESMVHRLEILAASENHGSAASTLKALSEHLRYTDMSVSVSVDEDMEAMISSLEAEYSKDLNRLTQDTISKKVTALNSLIARRKIETASAKEGGI